MNIKRYSVHNKWILLLLVVAFCDSLRNKYNSPTESQELRQLDWAFIISLSVICLIGFFRLYKIFTSEDKTEKEKYLIGSILHTLLCVGYTIAYVSLI